VSGRFEKDMPVTHARSGKSLRLTRPQRLFGQERETVEEAFPGDIVGLTNPGTFGLGDTVYAGDPIVFQEVPIFPPEVFATLRNADVGRLKQFEKGVAQLCEEGLVDLFWDRKSHRREPILGAVGKLQFEVVQHRLMSEYGVKTLLEPVSYDVVRWLEGDEAAIRDAYWGTNAKLIEDERGRPVLLVASQWTLNYLVEQNPKIEFLELPTEHRSTAAR
jgi:peptide chain release factor 3